MIDATPHLRSSTAIMPLAVVRAARAPATVLQPRVERLAHDLADVGPEQPSAIRSLPCSSAERLQLLGTQRKRRLREPAVKRRVRRRRGALRIRALPPRRGLLRHAPRPSQEVSRTIRWRPVTLRAIVRAGADPW